MILTVQHTPTLLVQSDTDEQWTQVSDLSPLNVLRRHPLYYRIMITDGMPLSAAHVAIEHEVDGLARDLAIYVRGPEFQGFLTDQLKALYPRKELWNL